MAERVSPTGAGEGGLTPAPAAKRACHASSGDAAHMPLPVPASSAPATIPCCSSGGGARADGGKDDGGDFLQYTPPTGLAPLDVSSCIGSGGGTEISDPHWWHPHGAHAAGVSIW